MQVYAKIIIIIKLLIKKKSVSSAKKKYFEIYTSITELHILEALSITFTFFFFFVYYFEPEVELTFFTLEKVLLLSCYLRRMKKIYRLTISSFTHKKIHNRVN